MKIIRRRLLVVAVVAVALTGGAWLSLAEPSQPPFGITHAAYHAIQPGMTIKDVERIVGQPAGGPRSLFRIGIRYESESDEDENLRSQIEREMEWYDDRIILGVSLNQDRLVWKKWFRSEPTLARLLRQIVDFWGKLGF